jgi:hypothetical protein
MKISLVQCAAVATMTLGMLAGCNGIGSQVPNLASNGVAPAGVAQAALGAQSSSLASMIALTTREHIVPSVHPNTGKSWMDPDARHIKYLLYASDEVAGTVDVYAARSRGHVVGRLTGFQFPYGECLDATGNVYIADFAAKDIVEYERGGTTPIKTLRDVYGFPIGCSVDPKTGDVAVANFEGVGRTCMGGIVIYKDASGRGRLYQDKDFNYYWPPGYDSQGNVYVEGRKRENRGTAGLAELRYGSRKLVTLSLSGAKVTYPGSVQWDGQYITATDQAFEGSHVTGVYRLTVTGSEAAVVGSTKLSDICLKGKVPYNDVVQPFRDGTNRGQNEISGGNLSCDYRFGFWKYVQGGDPKRALPYNTAPQLSYGEVVSPAWTRKP